MFDEKTGVPAHDNAARRLNRDIRKATKRNLSVRTPHGWKRKRVLAREVRRHYARAVYIVMRAQIQKDQEGA